jgi:hypothetical protein
LSYPPHFQTASGEKPQFLKQDGPSGRPGERVVEGTQVYILGHFQPSLRDCSRYYLITADLFSAGAIDINRLEELDLGNALWRVAQDASPKFRWEDDQSRRDD